MLGIWSPTWRTHVASLRGLLVELMCATPALSGSDAEGIVVPPKQLSRQPPSPTTYKHLFVLLITCNLFHSLSRGPAVFLVLFLFTNG